MVDQGRRARASSAVQSVQVQFHQTNELTLVFLVVLGGLSGVGRAGSEYTIEI